MITSEILEVDIYNLRGEMVDKNVRELKER
jgi:hypothetical protein